MLRLLKPTRFCDAPQNCFKTARVLLFFMISLHDVLRVKGRPYTNISTISWFTTHILTRTEKSNRTKNEFYRTTDVAISTYTVNYIYNVRTSTPPVEFKGNVSREEFTSCDSFNRPVQHCYNFSFTGVIHHSTFSVPPSMHKNVIKKQVFNSFFFFFIVPDVCCFLCLK